jgi:PQQ-dependent dehydrogenase (methanol/ethanol family)
MRAGATLRPGASARALATLGVLLGLAGCIRTHDQTGEKGGQTNAREDSFPAHRLFAAATVSEVPVAEDGQWVMASRDYANTRFSGLAQIHAGNVRELKLAWTFSDGNPFGHEGAPLVVGSTLYVVSPFPNQLFALDLSRPGAPVKWKYAPPYQRSAPGVSCCGHVNRGAAFADGRVFFNTLDNQVVAVDAATGAEVWRVRVGDINRGETMTMAPLVVKGKVIAGNSGGEFGVRGWLMALDAATGRTVWKAYATGPDRDVRIGPGFRPFYARDRGRDLGVRSWPVDGWKQGGGTAWGWVSYDPELDLVYYGTGNAGPWNPEMRPGDNKWAASVFARDPDTGEARWAYQVSPHDRQDYDAINESVLLDLPIGGRVRRVLVRAERNAYMYLMDRATGEVIAADSFGHNTVMRGVDRATGLPREVPEKGIRQGVVVREICPTPGGGKDWQPMAWSPRTRLLYVPAQNLCMDAEGVSTSYISGTPYTGIIASWYAGPGGHRGEFFAWDPVRRRKAWSIRERFPLWSGALATAGDVVFYGTLDRWFRAVDARTGTLLWQFRTGAGISAQPITFRAPDGKQYVAVMDGPGGWAGAVVENGLSPTDPTAADGFVGATGDLPQHTNRGGTLYVFGLP